MPKKVTESTSSSQVLTVELLETEDTAASPKDTHLDTLKEISRKLSTLINTVKDVKNSLNDWKDQTFSKTIAPTNDDNEVQIGQTLEQIRTYLEKINTPQLDTTVIQDTSPNNFLIEDEAFRIKSRISKLWDSNLKSRRLAYWQAFRNKKISQKL